MNSSQDGYNFTLYSTGDRIVVICSRTGRQKARTSHADVIVHNRIPQTSDKRALAIKEPMQIGEGVTNIMAPRRSGNTDTVETPDEVEVEAVDTSNDEVDEVATPAEGAKQAKEPKEKKEPARGDLPEGYVTPVGLAKELSKPKDGNAENLDESNWYHTDKNGGHEVRPQMVYSYKKNAPKEDLFPEETVQDTLGHERLALKTEDGFAWWTRKNERVGVRKQNAAEKAKKAAENAEKKAAAAVTTTSTEAAPEEVE